jgi:hypothetical protein
MLFKVWIVILGLVSLLGSALAQEPVIYPKKGQSNQKMEQDKYECYTWARNQSGFDPMAPPKTTSPPPVREKSKVGALSGAVGGGLVGLAAGSLMSEAGKGAAIGAASGALIGGVVKHKHQSKEEQKQQQWAQEQAELQKQNRNAYHRAFSACMEGRDYTVK